MPNLKTVLTQKQKAINSYLDKLFLDSEKESKVIFDAVRYSLLVGGKRLRPILTLLTCETCGEKQQKAMPVAAAIEMAHTFSLIHDDLPGVDNSDLRRGKPTCHKKFGEANAILAGDALMNHAFEHIALKVKPAELANRLVVELAQAIGVKGMIGGQTVDILAEKQKPNLKTLKFIHPRKTGALLKFSVRAGALLACAPPKKLQQFTKFGERIGLSFQVIDDILDATSTSKKLGKPVGQDKAAQKLTYPSLIGLDQSKKYAAKLVDDAKKAIKGLPNCEKLILLADYVVERTY